MKAFLSTMALCGVLLPFTGCESVPDTPAENQVRISEAAAMDVKQITDDTESILFLNRPMWMSRYPMPGQ